MNIIYIYIYIHTYPTIYLSISTLNVDSKHETPPVLPRLVAVARAARLAPAALPLPWGKRPRPREPGRGVPGAQVQGKILYTRTRKSENPVENAAENPWNISGTDPPGK